MPRHRRPAARRGGAAATPAVARVPWRARPACRMALGDRPDVSGWGRAHGGWRPLPEMVAVGPPAPPGIRDPGLGLRPLRGPAPDPGRGDRAPRRAAPARR